jgi:hypothetical protein
MKKIYGLIFFCLIANRLGAKTRSPSEFLGYELGDRFTPHHKIVAYFEHVAASNPNVKLQYYGTTYEQRPLLVAFVSAQENINTMETIRMDNLRRAGKMSGAATTKTPITWLSYNVHCNEAVSSEATMMTLWSLVDLAQPNTKYIKSA